jgi:hypothetical protein
VYVGGETSWSYSNKIIAKDSLTNDYFGNSVAGNTNGVYVGSWCDDDKAPNGGEGTCYIHMRF